MSLISLTGEPACVTGVACFDSYAKCAMHMLSACEQHGAKTILFLLELPGRSLSRRQLHETRNIAPHIPVRRLPWQRLKELRQEFMRSDAILMCLDGRRSRRFFLSLQDSAEHSSMRPILVSAYPGLIFRHHLEGMMDRSFADILCLNSEHDAKIYQQGCSALGLDGDNALVTGLPILWTPQQANATDADKDGSIIFFEQPSVPSSPLERRYIATRLLNLAQEVPNRKVLFKPRTSANEATLHRRHGDMERVIRRHLKRSPNMGVTTKPASVLLRDCHCAVTVSSTVALEAMARGISTRILIDFGINETLGNHFFVNSGCLTDLDSLIQEAAGGRIHPRHCSTWLDEHGQAHAGKDLFIERIQQLLLKEDRHSQDRFPPGWGSQGWQRHQMSQGGARMLASAGSHSRNKLRNRIKATLRELRQLLILRVLRR